MPAFQVLSSLTVQQHRAFTVFDPQNPEHMVAYLMLTNNQSRGQHPSLRFHLEHPYLDVVSMMQAKIARAYVKTNFKTNQSLMTMVGEMAATQPSELGAELARV